MLAILWLIIWATVGDAFYDDYNWYTADDGVSDQSAFDPQKVVRENFTNILRNYADSYIPEGDEELTMAKAKSRLRMLKVFTHTGNSNDFEPSKGQVLPLQEGAIFCRMGRHTKVECNHCTCVAGQLYMCTGMICPKSPTQPKPVITCNEGKRRKIDSCNYCYCRNGHEICSTRDCRLRHVHLLIRSQYTCHEWARRNVDCNRCICRHGEEYCSRKKCTKKKPTQMKFRQYNQMREGRCDEGQLLKIDCRVCKCTQNRWRCSDKNCGAKRKTAPQALRMTYSHDVNEPPRKCKFGERYRIDSCNYCYCNSDRERVCTHNKCTYPQHVDDKFPLDIEEKQCKIGSRFRKDECNYCYCNYNHLLVCSKNQCTRKSRYDLTDERELRRFTPAPKICLPHERFRLDNCNWCYCTKDRKRICERKPCDKKQKPDTRWPPNSPRRGCYIGSRFTRGKCEYCYCSVWRRIECRLRYNCKEDTTTTTAKPKINTTTQSTKPRNSLNFECEVGEIQRIDDCNVCRCTFNRKWLCSDNICPPNYDHLPMTFSEPECLVGEPVPAPDPCNVCICLDSHILCTENPCIRRQTVSKQPGCVEGHKYKTADGCNYCLCQGGQEFCTSRACLVSDNIISDSADCNEGEVTPAVDRCNMCVCMRGKIVCTNKNCYKRKLRDAISESLMSYIRTQNNKKHKMTQGTKQKCTPGKKYFSEDFDPNCPNECICDRHEVLCTKRKCYNNWDKKINKNFQGSNGIKGNMEKKNNTFCAPFTFFSPDNNRFCRNCFCLHNGLALCLLNLCKYSKDIPHQNSPEELAEVCNLGEYPTKCITCTCSEHGKWICTREELAICQGNATCPLGTFIRNPRQHCSVCLCGGDAESSHNMCFTEAKCVRQVISQL